MTFNGFKDEFALKESSDKLSNLGRTLSLPITQLAYGAVQIARKRSQTLVQRSHETT